MKKRFSMTDLDCASCAAKMEAEIKKIEGVKNASVNFIMQKLSIETDDSKDFNSIMDRVMGICKKIEPDCVINM